MKTLVVGAGYTGSRVVQQLPGEQAISLSRSQPGARRYDLDSADELPIDLPDRYSIIYTVPPALAAPDAPNAAATDTRLGSLLAHLAHPPVRFVYLSTTGVYGDRNGRHVDESATPEPASGRARRRYAAEQLLRAWCINAPSTLVILRVPGIYGPGRLGIDRIRAGTPMLTEKGANPGNRIHVDDLAACCIAALSPDTPAGVYNVGDGDMRSATWFAMEVARQCGLPMPPTVSRAEAERSFSESRLSFLRESRRVDTRKMRRVLAVMPRYTDAADGIAASLAMEKKN